MISELDNISSDWCNAQLTKLCIYLVAIACTKSHILYIDASLNFHEGEANLVVLHFASVIFFLKWLFSEVEALCHLLQMCFTHWTILVFSEGTKQKKGGFIYACVL